MFTCLMSVCSIEIRKKNTPTSTASTQKYSTIMVDILLYARLTEWVWIDAIYVLLRYFILDQINNDNYKMHGESQCQWLHEKKTRTFNAKTRTKTSIALSSIEQQLQNWRRKEYEISFTFAHLVVRNR